MDLATGGFDLLDQRLQLGAVTTAGEDGETFRSEFLGNLAADVIAGADYSHCPVSLHGLSPTLFA